MDEVVETEGSVYFPPLTSSTWETTNSEELGWSTEQLDDLLEFVESKETRAFIILKNGKIVVEEYWNKGLLGLDFNANSNWYWASAAKTLTSFLVGQAEQDGRIDLEASSSLYLGNNWSSLTKEQEDRITVRHHLTMTTGLDDTNNDIHCTDPECLTYLAEPGSRWAYHNGPYTILDGILEGATDEDFDTYFERKLKNPIGMDGFWTYQGYNHLYFSTARSMARFGLLMLNNGVWEGQKVIDNDDYLAASIESSQDINPSYGYLWWLNGKSHLMLPGLQLKFNQFLTPSAPAEMYAAMGKNGQFINIVPSENLVVIRMGASPDQSLVPTEFQDEVWKRLNEVMNK
jgi:CubicO group peptidase (beta-lactamase class C family)